MGKYDVTVVAEDLMLEAADLQEIYEVFFDDAQNLLAECKRSLEEQNDTLLKKTLHSLKGVANNLRMQEFGTLVAEMEERVAIKDRTQMVTDLSELHNKINEMRVDIDHFYTNGTKDVER